MLKMFCVTITRIDQEKEQRVEALKDDEGICLWVRQFFVPAECNRGVEPQQPKLGNQAFFFLFSSPQYVLFST